MSGDRLLPTAMSRVSLRSWQWRLTLPTLRQVWFQLHWFIGITAGTALVVIGLSGAALSFREEILDALNPGVRQVAPQAAAALAPAQIVEAVARAHGGQRIATLTMFAEPGASARVIFAPLAGERRGDTVYVDPYTGAMQAPLRGLDAMEWIDALHRWLLLPREPGRAVAGSLALCLLAMAVSGLYLRWPRRPLHWRSWLTFDTTLTGRPFLWGLHSVLGTLTLLFHLVLTTTGLYWSFDVVKQTVDGWAAEHRAPREVGTMGGDKASKKGTDRQDKAQAMAGGATSVDLGPAWATFRQRAGSWRLASLRMPERAGQAVQITWLSADAPHERARNRMSIHASSGEVMQDERYADQSAGTRLLTLVYPLHVGSYFGMPGRVAMLLAALALPLFAVTGWMLYLGRRRLRRSARSERDHLGVATSPADVPHAPNDVLLLAYASQSGHAERLAMQSGHALRAAGVAIRLVSLQRITPEDLRSHGRVLIVASSFGEGEPPDSARRFTRLLLKDDAPRLPGLRHAVLALGDSGYASFCGFGELLERRLHHLGALALFPLVRVDKSDPQALACWTQALAGLASSTSAGTIRPTDDVAAPSLAPKCEQVFTVSRLMRRELLNSGSAGSPLYELSLSIEGGTTWYPGALVDVLARHAPDTVADFLERHQLDGDDVVERDGERKPLREALTHSELLLEHAVFSSAQQCANALTAVAPRRYSVASLPQDGAVQLLVRQERHASGLGLASGWLTVHARVDGEVSLRLLPNPSFEACLDDRPCLYVGNGSGMAGLRAHLRARVLAGRRRNWLVFGERQRAHDRLCAEEIERWHREGFLDRVDLAFSRDGARQVYVQDCLRDAAVDVREWVARGAVIFVCGSMKGMASGVDEALAAILGRDGLERLIDAGRYRRDVY